MRRIRQKKSGQRYDSPGPGHAIGMLVLATPALAHDVPNETRWHTHDLWEGPATKHHKPVVFFPVLFEQAGLGQYGSLASGGYLDCPNARLLPSAGRSQSGVHAVGICMNDLYVIHLHSGVAAPAGWDSVEFGGNVYWYRVTGR